MRARSSRKFDKVRAISHHEWMLIAQIATLVIAVIHFFFMVLEMFFWTKPLGRRTFGLTVEKARDSAVLAANQGLYNGFLAAGLVWGALHPHHYFAFQIRVFFLSCVIIAGIYGTLTANKKILVTQALPAIIALILVWLFR
jgi:putative membrane protein